MKNLITVKEAAGILSVSTKTLYAWAELGEVPSVKLVGAVRFDSNDLQTWIQSKKKRYNEAAKAVAEPRKGRE